MAFNVSITPTASTPANTANTTLFTAASDTSAMVDVANIGTGTIKVRVGITPSGGSVHWKVYDLPVAAGESALNLGPWFLQTGDAITVRTDTANDATFSVTGVRSV